MRRSQFLTLLLAFPLVVTAGCKKKNRGSDVPKGAKVGLVLPNSGPYYQAVQKSAEELAQEKGYALVVQDAKGKASEQVRAIEQLLQQDVSVILVSPLELETVRPALQKAIEKKIYVVMLEEVDGNIDISTSVEHNQELAGQLAADYLAHKFKSGAKVAVLGSEADHGEPDRLTAFKEYLRRKQPSLDLVAEETNPTEAGQRALVDSLLKAHPDLDAIYALTDRIALFATEAIRAGKKGGGKSPIVVTYGGEPEAVAEVQKAGSPLEMLVGVFPQDLGERAGRLAYRIMTNKSTPSHAYLKVLPITKDNYGSYPTWDQPAPQDLTVPWTSELKIENKKED